MFNIDDQKNFNRSMNRYIGGVRRKESGFFKKSVDMISKVIKRLRSKEKVPLDLSEDQVHIEQHKPGFFQRLFKGKTIKEQEEIEEIMEKGPEEVKEKMENTVEDYETLNEVEDEIEHKKEGLFKRFTNVFKRQKKDEESEDVPIEHVQRVMEEKSIAHEHHEGHAHHLNTQSDVREDLKKISKITLSVIQRLSSEEQNAFKRSSDFTEYKRILEKNGLVKH